MSILRICAIAAVLLFHQAANLPAADVFVNNVTGDDRYDGSRPESGSNGVGPFRTIRRALRSAKSGDRIVLAKTEKPYRESVALAFGRHSGNPLKPFILEGNGATMDGSAPVPPDVWEHVQGELFRFPTRTAGPNQMLFGENGLPLPRATGGEGKTPVLEPLHWAVRDGWIYFRTEAGKLPTMYNLSYAALDVGITLYGASHVVVHDLVIQGYRLDGIQATDNVGECILSGLTLRGNGRSGAALRGSSRTELAGCLVGNNGSAQVIAEGYSRTQILRCDLVEAEGTPAVQKGPHVVVEQMGDEG